MSFATPLLLLGLLLVPVLVVGYARAERARRRRREALVPGPLLPSVAPSRPGWRRHVPVALQALALAALIVALARPQATRATPVEQANVVVVTDRSGSMLAKDVAPDRLTAARRAAQSFADAVPDDLRVGAIAFNQRASALVSPTRDREAVKAALGTVRAAGSTATGDALAAALTMIRRAAPTAATAAAPPAAVVLLSDGESVRGRDVLAVAEEARRAKVPVYTVALGTPTGTITSAEGRTTPVPPDTATLARVAERTGGEAFAIDDAERLEAVYERLGSQLATEDREVEVTGLFAGSALLLLFAGVAASVRWFGRVV